MDSRQVHNDPEQLRMLSTHMARLADSVEAMDHVLMRGLSTLGETFRDEEYAKFSHVFSRARARLVEFCQEARSLVPKLNHDADTLTAAKNVRLP